jgi:hypothetical protein
MTICGPVSGATLPTDLVITAGNAGTGAACTAAFSYTVGGTNEQVVTGYSTRVQRYCRWCSAPVGSNNKNELHIASFVPPTTATRKLKGVTVYASTNAGAVNIAVDATETNSK